MLEDQLDGKSNFQHLRNYLFNESVSITIWIALQMYIIIITNTLLIFIFANYICKYI